MTNSNYSDIALSWSPENRSARLFYLITFGVLALGLVLAIVVASIEVPVKERKPRQAAPERVAKFISQKKKVEPPKPKPPEVKKPPPPPVVKPKVVRKKQTEAEKKKPITVKEKAAREKAAQSGLLALSSELSDLIDTTEVSRLVGAKTKKASNKATQVAGLSSDKFAADIGKGSGGVATANYTEAVNNTTLSQAEIALVQQSLIKSDELEEAKPSDIDDSSAGPVLAQVRTEQEVALVFDQNKSQLFSIYNRERRKRPGLKGKIVLEITISPDGSVANARLISSELDHPKLESRIVSRVKRFKFEQKDVKEKTFVFPIEFLPS